MLATVLTCVVIACCRRWKCTSPQLIWPASQAFPNVDTAYVHVADGRGDRCLEWLDLLCCLQISVLAWSTTGGGTAALWDGAKQRAAKSFFGVVDEKHRVPRNNVFFVGAIVLIGAFFLSYGLGAEMLNFGALIAFMGVNAAAFVRY